MLRNAASCSKRLPSDPTGWISGAEAISPGVGVAQSFGSTLEFYPEARAKSKV